eukprot:s2087_g1.t1
MSSLDVLSLGNDWNCEDASRTNLPRSARHASGESVQQMQLVPAVLQAKTPRKKVKPKMDREAHVDMSRTLQHKTQQFAVEQVRHVRLEAQVQIMEQERQIERREVAARQLMLELEARARLQFEGRNAASGPENLGGCTYGPGETTASILAPDGVSETLLWEEARSTPVILASLLLHAQLAPIRWQHFRQCHGEAIRKCGRLYLQKAQESLDQDRADRSRQAAVCRCRAPCGAPFGAGAWRPQAVQARPRWSATCLIDPALAHQAIGRQISTRNEARQRKADRHGGKPEACKLLEETTHQQLRCSIGND